MKNGVPTRQVPFQVVGLATVGLLAEDAAVLVDVPRQAPDDGGARRDLHHFHLAAEAVGLRDVVGVHAGEQRRAAMGQAKVQAAGQAQVLLIADADDPAIADAIEDGPGVIRGGVIDDHQLEVGECLVEDALDGLLQVALGIVHRHEHGNGGRRGR